MRKAAPTASVFRGMRAEIGEGSYPDPSFWGNMLDLIYTGHPDLAWKLVSGHWPRNLVPREEFLQGFCDRLASSPYFEALRPTLANAPCVFKPRNGRRR